jgi:hypothetical protein
MNDSNIIRNSRCDGSWRPQCNCKREWIDAVALPPFQFVSEGVLFAVMFTAQRNAPGIAWLLCHTSTAFVVIDAPGTQMRGFGGGVIAAYATWQTANKLQMFFIANAGLSLTKLAHVLSSLKVTPFSAPKH